MILEIATFRIKITIDTTYTLNTPYLDSIKKMYQAGTQDSCDFEIQTIPDTSRPSSIYSMERRLNALYFENADLFVFETESWAATIDWHKKLMTTTFFNENLTEPHDRLLIRSLKLLLSLLSLKKGGLPCHCSAITKDNSFSIIFPGRSNTGKTTIAHLLSKEWRIYNDEFNIILPCKNSYYVFSTPFTTPDKLKFCTTGYAPLKKIFFLEKSRENKIREMSLKQQYLSLLQCVYAFPTSEEFSNYIMTNTENIYQSIPIDLLYFNHISTIAEDFEQLYRK